MKRTKNENRDAQKKRPDQEVRGVSSKAGRESMVGKICEGGRLQVGSERVRDLRMVKLVNQRRKKMWQEQEKASRR